MKKQLLNTLLTLKMAATRRLLWQPLVRKTLDPKKCQEALLRQILKNNLNTRFGREHGFHRIRCYEDYRRRVPVCDYEALRCYIEAQEDDKLPHLNSHLPVMYAQTSGTTGRPKNIPILQSTIKQHRQSQQVVAYSIYSEIPEAYDGKILVITSPAVEGTLESGTKFGSMSGLIYQSMPKVTRRKYVVPANVFQIEDYQEKYLEIAKLALAEENITMIATANPSTLVEIIKVINDRFRNLLDGLRLTDAGRARDLQYLFVRKGTLSIADLWPNLRAVVTWTGGSCGVLIPELKKQFPSDARFVELGYLASEFRGGITLDVRNNLQIPTLHENFMEFVEKELWENGTPKFMRLHEIEKGQQYYIFVTTSNGLYRYNINDLIEVTGKYNNTPTIAFIQKGKGVTNLTGEKLYEGQLIQAMTEIVERDGMDIRFFKMLGNPANREYTLYVNQAKVNVRKLENRLSELNIEFRAKLKSGRLKPIRMVPVSDATAEAYKQHCLARGQRESQFKMNYLQMLQDCTFNFKNYVRGTSHASH